MARRRIAVIGLGMAAAPHARSLADLTDRVEVAAAYSPTATRRAAFAETYGFPVTHDIDGLFADSGIDAVMILTPPASHLDIVRRAAKAGKHILLEKPLEITPERAVQLVETAETADVKLGIVLQHRFRPISTALRKLIDDGRLGDLVSASARLMNWRPQDYYDQPGRGTKTRDGGGVLLTQAIHTLDLLISLVGAPHQVSACATTSPVHHMETEDLVSGWLSWPDGAHGTVFATTAAYPGLSDAIDIIGTRGTASLTGTQLSARFHDGTNLELADDAAGTGVGADPMAFSHEHHRAALVDFLDAIEAGRDPKVSGREALKVHALVDAMLRSAESGQIEAPTLRLGT